MKASITINIEDGKYPVITTEANEAFQSLTDDQKWTFLHDAILELQLARDLLESQMINDQTEDQGCAAAPASR